jgi:bifunctional DNA-binding transcriptional regulator/antitoxin component of YhaV-PrlF toxin-antitoxin module
LIEVFTIPKSGTKRNSLRITIPVAVARKYKLKVGSLLGLEDTGDGIKLMPVTKKGIKKLLKVKIKGVECCGANAGIGAASGAASGTSKAVPCPTTK